MSRGRWVTAAAERAGRACTFAHVAGPASRGRGRGFPDGGRRGAPARPRGSFRSEVTALKASVGMAARACQRAETRRILPARVS